MRYHRPFCSTDESTLAAVVTTNSNGDGISPVLHWCTGKKATTGKINKSSNSLQDENNETRPHLRCRFDNIVLQYHTALDLPSHLPEES